MEQYIETYHSRLSPLNLFVRKHLLNYKKDFMNLNRQEKETIYSDIQYCSSILRKYNRLSTIPWKLYFFNDITLNIENNYPHTHWDTIFLPYLYFFRLDVDSRRTLLLHEFIHVYQRMYPIPFNKLLVDVFGLKVTDTIDAHVLYDQIRFNPDLNNIIYTTTKNSYNLQLFQKSPHSLADSSVVRFGDDTRTQNQNEKTSEYEHPFEQVAYELSNALYENNSKIIDKYEKFL
jgi:hypothetical protein